jgi:predicted transcriptional regulator
MARKWRDIRRPLDPESEQRIKEWVDNEVVEANLRRVRDLLGKTQEEIAAALQMRQSTLSQQEARHDHKVSTLRRYVETLGGELEIVARFGDKSVRLSGH